MKTEIPYRIYSDPKTGKEFIPSGEWRLPKKGEAFIELDTREGKCIEYLNRARFDFEYVRCSILIPLDS